MLYWEMIGSIHLKLWLNLLSFYRGELILAKVCQDMRHESQVLGKSGLWLEGKGFSMACDWEPSLPHNTISWWWRRQQQFLSLRRGPSLALCASFSLHPPVFTTSLWDLAKETTAQESCDPRMLLGANKFLAIHQTKPPCLEGAAFPFPPLHPPLTLCSHLEAWFVCLLIAALAPAVTHQLGLPAPHRALAGSLYVAVIPEGRRVLSFAVKTGQDVARFCVATESDPAYTSIRLQWIGFSSFTKFQIS